MKRGRLQCKDIPDEPILRFLAQHQGQWATWFPPTPRSRMPSVWGCFPEGTPEKLVVAKMASLIRRGLSGGCECGCRGDYEITDKGLALIGEPRTQQYGGY